MRFELIYTHDRFSTTTIFSDAHEDPIKSKIEKKTRFVVVPIVLTVMAMCAACSIQSPHCV